MSEPVMYCSFCRKSQHEVRALIAGPDVLICDECVAVCNTILRYKSAPRRWLRALLRIPDSLERAEAFVRGITRTRLSSPFQAPNRGASHPAEG